MQLSNNNRMMKSALLYAKRFGFAVFPLNWIENGKCSCGRINSCSQGKHPLTEKGLLDATKDVKQIINWWTKWPNANIGIACGTKSGVFVLDVDINDGVNGYDTIRELESKYGDLPKTPLQLSGSGGSHYFFINDVNVKNKVDFNII